LRYDALPNADRYRANILSSIERASGMSVSVRAIQGGWGGLRPVLWLEGLRISDRRGRAAFQLQRAEVTLSWWALLGGQVRFHDMDLYRPQLELRRGADGLIYLADKPLNDSSKPDDGAFTEWLLAQPRLGIHDATLTWRDDFLGASEVTLTSVEIAMVKRLGHHRAALTAAPPRELAARIDVRANLVFSREGARWVARGELYGESLNADLARLRSHLPVPETLRSGVGSLRVWARFTPAAVEEIVADLNVRDAQAKLAADLLPLELASLSGRATYTARAQGFSFATEGLRFRLPNGLEATPGRFSLTRDAEPGKTPRLEVRADGIDLKIAAALIDYFPVPRDVKGQVLRFAPRGRISDAMLALSDDGERTYAVKGRFEDLSINPVEALPGIEGFDGTIEGTEAGGTLTLATRKASVELFRIFRAPILLDVLEARARWKPDGRALEVTIEEAKFANADAEGRFAGTWRSLPDAKVKSPGFLDLKGSLTRASVTRVPHYVPDRLEKTRDWLERAVEAGESSQVDFTLKGDLYEFPFANDSAGRFVVEGDLRNARLRYHPDWPLVDAIDGSFRFENRRMEIRATGATIFASRLKSASAVIEDFGARPPVLTFQADIDTSGNDSVRFLRESPLVNGPGAFSRAIAIEGPARLKLRIDYPLWGTDPVRVAGDYNFAGATATAAKTLALRDVKGRLAFTERGVRAPELTGTLFGEPATLAMVTQPDGLLLTTLEGRIDARALGAYLPEPVAARLAGATDWKARVLSGRAGTDLTITSDLQGLAVSLPEPLAKAAEGARALTLQVSKLGSDQESSTAALAGGIHGRFNRAAPGAERWQAAVRFGAPVAGEALRDGLWLYGELAAIDVDAWQALFARPARAADSAPPEAETRAAALELRGLDLKLGRARFLGRDFRDMGARLARVDARWSGVLESPLIAGEVSWDPANSGNLHARLARLSIPEPTPGSAAAARDEAGNLPAIDLVAERFDFRGRNLGRLDLQAQPAGDEWRIARLDLDAGHSTLRSTGVWRRTGPGSLTTLAGQLEVKNANALMATFGYGDYLKRGSGQVEASLAWPGLPSEFALAALSGTMKLEARGGQFAKIEPGAGKLLGLLSLQSLPRRALLDFRDVFSDGFAFERVAGDVKVARGVLVTDNFEISGPAAFVSLSGEVSLPQETQSLTMRVVPEVGEGMALAATVFGTPVLGLSTLLVSKLLKNPFGKVVAYEYQVTGSWDNPVVTRLSAAAPAKAASAPQASAVSPP
jgi:uncharacterized protein (TIGR02099 family)